MSPATARSDSSRSTLLTFSGEEQPPEPGEPNGWDELPTSTATSEPLHRLLALVGEDRGRVVRGTLLQAGQALSHIPFTAGVGLFIDHILPTSDLRLVAAYFIANLLLLPIHGWFTVEAFRVSEELVRGAISRVQTALVVQLQRMRLDFFVHRGAGTLANQLTVDLERLQRFLEHAANAFVVNLVVGAATLIYLTFLNWRLALVALVAIPLQLALVQLFVGESKQLSSRAQRAGEGFTSRIVEFVFGMRLVKSFGNERLAANKLRSKIRRLERERVDASVALRRLLMRSHMVGMAVPVVVWSLGAYLHFRGSVTVGELVAFVGLLAFVQNGFTAFSDTYQQWIAARPGLESLFSVLDSQEQEGAQLEEDVEHLEGTIELRDVDFSYAGSESPLFEGLALTVPRGQRVALVGPSGAGKSTFLDLMLGFRDVSGGQIRIGGREFSPALRLALRRRTATMGQDAFLFNTTILENIRFGRPGASDQECIEAARRARVDEFVQRLPEGYASSCGEQGGRLSGGQRQRVALARLFLRDPDIVILDEPTSALDVETEARLLEDLEEFCEGRTTFVVAHRLSTIRLCQRVLVFQDGKIVEDGSPEALRNRPDSFFAQLWELQSGRRPPRESGESLIA